MLHVLLFSVLTLAIAAKNTDEYLQRKLDAYGFGIVSSDNSLGSILPRQCNPCTGGKVCKGPADQRWDDDQEFRDASCDNDEFFSCLDQNRFCTSEEAQGKCPDDQACVKYFFHACPRGVHVRRSAFRCVYKVSPCSKQGFIPGNKACRVGVKRLGTTSDDSVEYTMIEDRPSCGATNHCPSNMGCWLDHESYNDGLTDAYAERCTFQEDPCIGKVCPASSRCEIESESVKDPKERKRICEARGTTWPICGYLWPSTEIVVCSNATKKAD